VEGFKCKVEGVTLANNVDAVLDQIEAQQVIELPENGTSLDLLRQVYRNPSLPLMTRMRAATAALPHEHPKLAVTTLVNVGDFADQLEQAIERSRKAVPTMIQASANQIDSPESISKRTHESHPVNGGKPMIVDRRYRRW
jgi:hypothetical protein